MIQACELGHVPLVSMLLKLFRMDPNLREGTPLVAASVHSRSEVAGLLLQHGAHVYVQDSAPLKAASAACNLDLVSGLLAAHAEQEENYHMRCAAMAGTSLEAYKKQCKVAVMAQREQQLLMSCHCGLPGVAKEQLENGVDVNLNSGLPLVAAIYCKKLEMVQVLLDNGADPNIQDGRPLMDALHSEQEDVVRMLVDFGADLDIKSGLPLASVCRPLKPHLVKLLVELGADPDAHDGLALALICGAGDDELLDWMVANGADPTAGRVLPAACRVGSQAMAEKIIRMVSALACWIELSVPNAYVICMWVSLHFRFIH